MDTDRGVECVNPETHGLLAWRPEATGDEAGSGTPGDGADGRAATPERRHRWHPDARRADREGAGRAMETLDISLAVERAHRTAMRASIDELAQNLQAVLSRRLTAYIAGVQDGKTVSRWASGEVTVIRDPEMERRLRAAYEVVELLRANEDDRTVRTWFIGLNPRLGGSPPADTIREGRLREALGAAQAFLVHS